MEKTRLERLEMVLLSCKARQFMKGNGRPKFQLSIQSLQNLHIFKLEKKPGLKYPIAVCMYAQKLHFFMKDPWVRTGFKPVSQ